MTSLVVVANEVKRMDLVEVVKVVKMTVLGVRVHVVGVTGLVVVDIEFMTAVADSSSLKSGVVKF